jgi:lantibiotic leader peptide-processing serine protease
VRSRLLAVGAGLSAAALVSTVTVLPALAEPERAQVPTTDYTVLLEDSADRSAAHKAVEAAGGQVRAENPDVKSFTVTAPATGFIEKVSADAAVLGAARARAIGFAPKAKGTAPAKDDVERENHAQPGTAKAAAVAGKRGRGPALDPLDEKLWGLKMIRADLARRIQAGDKRVLVGVLDTGVDGAHPDLGPNFNAALSRNFTTDIPTDPKGHPVDGPCEFPGCKDPANWDDNGHGTHVAGTIAAAANGFGISGIAPKVSLVNLRGGLDSGFFFLDSVVNALTYGARTGVDVINMSFFVDPWLYNCLNNPADSAEARLEQRTIIRAMSRAQQFAHARGVTLVGALGNNHEDLGKPRTDVISPNYPAESAYPRPVDNKTCWDLPVEGPHTIGVSALGPSGKKSDYSNYGREQISVSAPGGYFRDFFGTPQHRQNANMILSTAPKHVLQAEGAVDPAGNVTPAGAALGVTKACTAGGVCGYYQYLQGTSMAAPHASGVAALIVSQYGVRDPFRRNGGKWLPALLTEKILTGTAQETACPTPRLVTYTNEGRPAEFNALCEGGTRFNGFYGHGIVDAYAAVRGWHR